MIPAAWKVTEPSFVDGIPDDVYHAGKNTPADSVSQSQLKLLLPPSTPAHFLYRLHNPEGPKRVFDVGRAAHTLALGVGEPMAACPDDLLSVDGKMTTRDAKKWALEQRAAGVVPLTPADYRMVKRMAEALAEHDRVAEVLTEPGNRPEVSAYAIHPELGMWVRGRFDLLGGRPWDYKTTVCAEPGAFERSAYRYGYHVQDRVYRLLHEWVLGEDPGPIVFIAQEKEPPYLPSTTVVDDDLQRLAVVQVDEAFALLAECRATKHWPGYPEEVVPLAAPYWALRSHGLVPGSSPRESAAEPAGSPVPSALDADVEAAFEAYFEGFQA